MKEMSILCMFQYTVRYVKARNILFTIIILSCCGRPGRIGTCVPIQLCVTYRYVTLHRAILYFQPPDLMYVFWQNIIFFDTSKTFVILFTSGRFKKIKKGLGTQLKMFRFLKKSFAVWFLYVLSCSWVLANVEN